MWLRRLDGGVIGHIVVRPGGTPCPCGQRGCLKAVEPFLLTWLGHESRDDHWRHGSVCEDYGAIDAAVLAVGGCHTPSRDTVCAWSSTVHDGSVPDTCPPTASAA